MLNGMPSDMTTVKVRRATRERLSAAAGAHHKTIEEYLAFLLDEQQWRERVEQARAAMAEPDSDYVQETAWWDTAADDGTADAAR